MGCAQRQGGNGDGISIHRIVGGKIAEEWSEDSGLAELRSASRARDTRARARRAGA